MDANDAEEDAKLEELKRADWVSNITAFLYTAGRLFKYDVICSQVAGYNSNKQNDPIDDALRGRHALASLPAGIWALGLFEIWIKTTRNFPVGNRCYGLLGACRI